MFDTKCSGCNMRKNFEEVYIYGDISNDVFTETDVSPKKFKDLIDDIKDAKELRIHINSYGGSVLAGFGIINIIEKFKKDTDTKVVIYIDGIAAGIASAVVMYGDKIYMSQEAMLMIKKSYIIALANDCITDSQMEELRKYDDMLISAYMKRFKGTEAELRQLMSDETWMSAEEAMKRGFIDEIAIGESK